MQDAHCICALLPRTETTTRIVLVMHHVEARRTTNTGRLVLLAFPKASAVVRGRPEDPEPPIPIPEGTRPLLLYPAEDAVPLDEVPPSPLPTTLVVPDGNWRQASKVRLRAPGMRAIPCVKLPPGPPSAYRLREEAHPHAVSTVEAIARALRILREEEAAAVLDRAFGEMVRRTIFSRGQHLLADLPPGATSRT